VHEGASKSSVPEATTRGGTRVPPGTRSTQAAHDATHATQGTNAHPTGPQGTQFASSALPWGTTGSGVGLTDSKAPQDTVPAETAPAPTPEPARPRIEVIQRWGGPDAEPSPDTPQKKGPAKQAPPPTPQPTPAPKEATAPQTPTVPEVEVAKQRVPKWRQDCITAFADCKYQKWSGDCFACFEQCMGQKRWPKEKCPAPWETK